MGPRSGARLERAKPLRELTGVGANALAWLDDERFLSGGHDGKLYVWDLESGKSLMEMDHDDQIVAIATDGKVAWTGGWDKVRTIKRWDLASGTLISETELEKPCASMARSPDGSKVACVTYGGALHVFDWASGKQLAHLAKAHDDRADKVAFTSDSKHVATCSELDNTLRLFDVSGKPLDKKDLPRPGSVGVGPNGVVYVGLAYQRIDRFKVAKDALVAT